jgi:glycerol-3-phosphate dehydrogenase
MAMYDLLIIGGGINGVGIARDAAGRGLKVLLCERDDLASATSSASSKLIHGGLRYLESYEFRLVRESLGERETLLNIAPHLIWPLRFVLPVMPGMRPAWMLRIGLFLYDHLAKRSFLPATKSLNLRACAEGEPLKDNLTKGFAYSDCWGDDARLTIVNAVDAKERGAVIQTRTTCTALDRRETHWRASLRHADQSVEEIQARSVVNAAGPWVEEVLGLCGRKSNSKSIRLVKGSHIVTKRLFEGDHVYLFQSADGRVIFAIPYEHDFTLIGTTEQDWSFGQGKVEISEAEINYLCTTASQYFKAPVTPEDVVWTYAGVRPLFDDKNESASVVTRDYVFDLDEAAGLAPLLSIYGGKLTTYRKLAEQALDKLSAHFPAMTSAWTSRVALPGGDFSARDPHALVTVLANHFPWLPRATCARLAQAYGTRASTVIGAATSLGDLGQCFGADLYEAELIYLRDAEFAQTADDVLWRRSKLGLRLTPAQQGAVDAWFTQNSGVQKQVRVDQHQPTRV